MSEEIIDLIASHEIEVFAGCQPMRSSGWRQGVQSVADRRHRRGPAGYNSCDPFGNDYFDYVNRCGHDGVWLKIGYCGLFSPDRS